MKRLSRERVIEDIEFIVHTPPPPAGTHEWESSGAKCLAERHSFSGTIYQFSTEVLHITFPASGKPKWKIVLVAEYWHLANKEEHVHRWIKLLSGSKADVMKWVISSRDAILASQVAMPALEPQ